MEESIKRRVHTSLGVEEHEGLVKSESVVIRRSVVVLMARDSLDDESDKTSEESRDEQGANCPNEDLTADDDAAQIHILLLLLLPRWSQKPALLGLIQRPRWQRRPIEVLKVPAPIVVCSWVRRIDLQWTPPGIPSVHTYCLLLLLTLTLLCLKLWRLLQRGRERKRETQIWVLEREREREMGKRKILLWGKMRRKIKRRTRRKCRSECE